MSLYSNKGPGALAQNGDIQSQAAIEESKTGEPGLAVAHAKLRSNPSEDNRKRVCEELSKLGTWFVRS